jgi:hypothetical protein
LGPDIGLIRHLQVQAQASARQRLQEPSPPESVTKARRRDRRRMSALNGGTGGKLYKAEVINFYIPK